MTDETTTTKAVPTLAELEGKVQRLTNQVGVDDKAAVAANDNFAKAVKSGDVDRALELADARTVAKATAAKSVAQLKTATNAVASAKHAANADKIAAIHNAMRTSSDIQASFKELEGLGATRLVIERSTETGKLIINSAGPKVKSTRAPGSGGGGGGRGEPLIVDGQSFDSASAALVHFRPDFEGKMGRSAIVSWLTNAGHEVS